MTPWTQIAVGLTIMFIVWEVAGQLFTWERRASDGWPSVQGTITVSRVLAYSEPYPGPRDAFTPRLGYEYEVGGQSYRGDRFEVDTVAMTEADARAVVKSLPVGTSVPVFYDPRVHANSVLRPGLGGVGPLLWAVRIGLGAVVIAVWARALIRRAGNRLARP